MKKVGLVWRVEQCGQSCNSMVSSRLKTHAEVIQSKLARWETSILSQSKWVEMELHDLIYAIITYIFPFTDHCLAMVKGLV